MNEPLHLAGVDGFAHDRIAELHATAVETRAPRRVSVDPGRPAHANAVDAGAPPDLARQHRGRHHA